jgi:hypothetical protein
MSNVYFKPWIGDDYKTGKRFGKRVMILGESHYQKRADDPPVPGWTRRFIRYQMYGERSRAFWTHIVSAFIGHHPVLKEKEDFWRSVAFYNYLQQSVGDGPRIPPSPTMWKDSERPFEAVLNKHEPQVLIVLGYRLWRKLPYLEGTADEPIDCPEQPQTWRYPLKKGGYCLAYGIKHPSSGFTSSDWRPHILEAIRRAPA